VLTGGHLDSALTGVVGHPLLQRREGRRSFADEALEEARWRKLGRGAESGTVSGTKAVAVARLVADERRDEVELLARSEGGKAFLPFLARQRPHLHRLIFGALQRDLWPERRRRLESGGHRVFTTIVLEQHEQVLAVQIVRRLPHRKRIRAALELGVVLHEGVNGLERQRRPRSGLRALRLQLRLRQESLHIVGHVAAMTLLMACQLDPISTQRYFKGMSCGISAVCMCVSSLLRHLNPGRG